MEQVTIPRSIEEARASLDGLGKLLIAKEWERAAVVYAFTRDAGQGAYQQKRNSAVLTTGEFAALGIAGLKSDTTVRDYRRAWQTAIDDGQATPVHPGDKVDLPTRAWPPNPKQHTSTQTEVITGVRALLREDPDKTIRDIIKGEPEVISALARGVMNTPPVEMLVRRTHDSDIVREHVPYPHHEPDYSQDLRYAVNGLLRVLSAMRDGKWTPDAMETTLLHFLRQAFAEIAGDETPSTYNVIDEIESFLVGQR